ncbi:MAG: molybdopterin oxidoreductase family protein [Actinomycetota bacterium]
MAGTEIPVQVRGACPHNCPDRCAWLVTVKDGVATELRGDPDHPFTRGGLCAKVDHYLERVYDPNRLLYPLKRTGPKGSGSFERVSWDEALDGIASRLAEIIDEHGGEAVLPCFFSGTLGLLQNESMSERFFARIGSTKLERTLCGTTSWWGVEATQGSALGVRPEDMALDDFIVLWGSNAIVTNLHQWPFIREARSRGATIVVVDPLKTRTAQAADEHIQPFPGTDTALALGMMNVILAEGLQDEDYISRHTLGFERLEERVREYPLPRVSSITGLDQEKIEWFARSYATRKPSCIQLGIGMEKHSHGAMTYRTVSCLPALTGAWRDRGGGLFHLTFDYFDDAVAYRALARPDLRPNGVREVNIVRVGKALTDPALDPPIRSLIVYNCNPATILPNQGLVLEGLTREDLFTVVHEQFMTDTALYADYVLPATTEVEHLDLLTAYGHTYLTLNLPAIPPVGEAVANTEFFRRLAARMGLDDPCLSDTDEDLVRQALESNHPYLDGITLERLEEEGWAPLSLPEDWRPFAEGGFHTPSGKAEFFAQRLADEGLDPLPQYQPAPESPQGDAGLADRFPLIVITAKSALHFLNSSYSGMPRHLKAEKEPLLEIHPHDAEARGLSDGDMARAFNDRGEVLIRIRVSDRVRPGVVSMPFGWWASKSPGGTAANALTPDGTSDRGGGPVFYDTLVEVAATGG